MIVRCPGCQTAYRLEPHRVPATAVRVRCPRCTHVFRLRAASEGATEAASTRAATRPWSEALPGLEREGRPPAQIRPRPESGQEVVRARRPTWDDPRERTLQLDSSPANRPAETPRLETAPFRAGEAVAVPGASLPAVETPGPAAVAPVPPPAAPAEGASPSRAHERARRLARVLVSDILVYNREMRERALQDGNLITALGAEINKAWELYKSKVSPEVVGNTTYFKDALNEILAEGQKVF